MGDRSPMTGRRRRLLGLSGAGLLGIGLVGVVAARPPRQVARSGPELRHAGWSAQLYERTLGTMRFYWVMVTAPDGLVQWRRVGRLGRDKALTAVARELEQRSIDAEG